MPDESWINSRLARSRSARSTPSSCAGFPPSEIVMSFRSGSLTADAAGMVSCRSEFVGRMTKRGEYSSPSTTIAHTGGLAGFTMQSARSCQESCDSTYQVPIAATPHRRRDFKYFLAVAVMGWKILCIWGGNANGNEIMNYLLSRRRVPLMLNDNFEIMLSARIIRIDLQNAPEADLCFR